LRFDHITLAVAMGVLITLATLLPTGSVEALAPGSDKLHHFLPFAAFMLPTAYREPARILPLALAGLVLGAAIEVVQPLVGRDGEWGDLAADAAGILFGAVLGLGLGRARALLTR
jgi:VanZ family protein